MRKNKCYLFIDLRSSYAYGPISQACTFRTFDLAHNKTDQPIEQSDYW